MPDSWRYGSKNVFISVQLHQHDKVKCFSWTHSQKWGWTNKTLLQSCPCISQATSAIFCEPKSFQWFYSHHSQSATEELARFLTAVSSNLRAESCFHILCFWNPLPTKQEMRKQLDFNLPVKSYWTSIFFVFSIWTSDTKETKNLLCWTPSKVLNPHNYYCMVHKTPAFYMKSQSHRGMEQFLQDHTARKVAEPGFECMST